MKPACYRISNFLLLSILLPLLSGCGGGGGGGLGGIISSFLGNSGNGGGGNSDVADLLSGGGSGVETLATIHNPEPTTMLLMGGGLAAMAFCKKRFKKS